MLEQVRAAVLAIGLGDQFGYPEWFVDAMGMLHDKVVKQGAEIIGKWPVEGYEFESRGDYIFQYIVDPYLTQN